MPQANSVKPKDKSWAAAAFKELGLKNIILEEARCSLSKSNFFEAAQSFLKIAAYYESISEKEKADHYYREVATSYEKQAQKSGENGKFGAMAAHFKTAAFYFRKIGETKKAEELEAAARA